MDLRVRIKCHFQRSGIESSFMSSFYRSTSFSAHKKALNERRGSGRDSGGNTFADTKRMWAPEPIRMQSESPGGAGVASASRQTGCLSRCLRQDGSSSGFIHFFSPLLSGNSGNFLTFLPFFLPTHFLAFFASLSFHSLCCLRQYRRVPSNKSASPSASGALDYKLHFSSLSLCWWFWGLLWNVWVGKKNLFYVKKKMITYHFFRLGSQPVEMDLLSAVSPSVSRKDFFFFLASQGLSGAKLRARPCGSPSPSLLRFPPRLPSWFSRRLSAPRTAQGRRTMPLSAFLNLRNIMPPGRRQTSHREKASPVSRKPQERNT